MTASHASALAHPHETRANRADAARKARALSELDAMFATSTRDFEGLALAVTRMGVSLTQWQSRMIEDAMHSGAARLVPERRNW